MGCKKYVVAYDGVFFARFAAAVEEDADGSFCSAMRAAR